MKKLPLVLSLILALLSQLAYSQYFQKSFGKVYENTNSDQQEFYDVTNNNQSLIAAGTFRNIQTFPEAAFYGTVTKLDKSGALNWYKGYLPSGFAPLESLLIKSVVTNAENEMYALGAFQSSDTNSGYLLMKLDADGHVLFTKKIKDAFPGFDPKLVANSTGLFAILESKIVKFDWEGNVMRAVSSPLISYRDITFDANDYLVAVGNYNNPDPNAPLHTGLPVVRFTQELDFVNGSIIYSENLGALYAFSIISPASGNLIIGGPSSYLSIDYNNDLLWAKTIPSTFTEATPFVDDYGSFWEFRNDDNGHLYFVASGFFNNDDSVVSPTSENEAPFFQLYTALGTIDPANGNILSSKEIKNGHFNTINHIEIYGITIDNDIMFGAGRTTDYTDEYHLNYIHATSLDQLNCGESSRQVATDDITQEVSAAPLSDEGFSDEALIVNDINMVEVDIPVNYENQSCSEALKVNETETVSALVIPNPAQDKITITGIPAVEEVALADCLGRQIKVLVAQTCGQYDISFLNSGIYYLRIKTTDNSYIKKLIKQ